MIPVDTPARRAICAMVASCIPTSFIASSVASISCLRRIGCIPSLGIFATPFISVG